MPYTSPRQSESSEIPAEAYQHKRLIICCDGTWQASDKPIERQNVTSNVTNLCRALKLEDNSTTEPVQQIVYYQSGIGTDVFSKISKDYAGGLGIGLTENVLEAYNFLSLNYQRYDQIYMFGFSRGAYTVRALASFVSAVGILKKTMIEHHATIYSQYKIMRKSDENMNAMKETLRKLEFEASGYLWKTCDLDQNPQIDDVSIEIVGVWDTVGSLGIPDTWMSIPMLRDYFNSKHSFHNPNLTSRIKRAFHALALDEHRRPFSPTLWHLPKDGETNQNSIDGQDTAEGLERGMDPDPLKTDLVQCWFPGVHINIGGGNDDDLLEDSKGDRGQIASITFAWMVDLCRPYLAFDEKVLKTYEQHYFNNLTLKKKGQTNRAIPGWAQGPFQDSYDSMATGGSLTRAPGQYGVNNEIVDFGTEGLPPTQTNEWIHPSVRIRVEATRRSRSAGIDWLSPVAQRALRHFKYVSLDLEERFYSGSVEGRTSSGLGWRMKRSQDDVALTIPEWKIAQKGDFKDGLFDNRSFEERLILLDDENLLKEVKLIALRPKGPLEKKPVNPGEKWENPWERPELAPVVIPEQLPDAHDLGKLATFLYAAENMVKLSGTQFVKAVTKPIRETIRKPRYRNLLDEVRKNEAARRGVEVYG